MAKFMKDLLASQLRDELVGVDTIFVVSLGSMSAEDNFSLRNELRGMGASLRVIHNRTAKYALDDSRQGLYEYFTGQTALTLVPGEDPDLVNVAKAVVAAAKKKHVLVRGGFVDGEVIDRAGVEFISKSPDKQTLRGMLAGTILAPGRGLAVAMQGLGAGLARCLQARVDEGGEDSAAATTDA